MRIASRRRDVGPTVSRGHALGRQSGAIPEIQAAFLSRLIQYNGGCGALHRPSFALRGGLSSWSIGGGRISDRSKLSISHHEHVYPRISQFARHTRRITDLAFWFQDRLFESHCSLASATTMSENGAVLRLECPFWINGAQISQIP